MGNKSKRSHWTKKWHSVGGTVVQYKRLVRGHGCDEQKPKTKTAPQGAGSGLFVFYGHTALSDHLRKHGASPRKVAEHLGIAEREVENWCQGIGLPNVWQAVRIAELLQCDLRDLYLAILRTR